jgi:hypothetical protein
MLGRPFAKGMSGNPGGRPKMVGHVRELARAHSEQAITVLAKIMGNAKSPPAARVAAANAILDRGYGRAGNSIIEPDRFNSPDLCSAADATKAMAVITAAVARGDLAPAEAGELGRLVEAYVKTIEATEIERRLQTLEERQARETGQ